MLDAQFINANYEDKTMQLGGTNKNTYVYQDYLEQGIDSVPGINNNFRIVQNPEEQTLTVVDKEESIKHITLSNVLGQVLLDQVTVKHNRHTVQLTNFPSGIYLISVFENDEIKTKAFTITR